MSIARNRIVHKPAMRSFNGRLFPITINIINNEHNNEHNVTNHNNNEHIYGHNNNIPRANVNSVFNTFNINTFNNDNNERGVNAITSDHNYSFRVLFNSFRVRIIRFWFVVIVFIVCNRIFIDCCIFTAIARLG